MLLKNQYQYYQRNMSQELNLLYMNEWWKNIRKNNHLSLIRQKGITRYSKKLFPEFLLTKKNQYFEINCLSFTFPSLSNLTSKLLARGFFRHLFICPKLLSETYDIQKVRPNGYNEKSTWKTSVKTLILYLIVYSYSCRYLCDQCMVSIGVFSVLKIVLWIKIFVCCVL